MMLLDIRVQSELTSYYAVDVIGRRWPMKSRSTVPDVIAARCHRCQTAKKPGASIRQPPGHLLATAPLEMVAMDFTKLEYASDGREDVLILTDVFTKWTVAITTRD